MYINVNRDSPEVCGMSFSLTRLHLVPHMTHIYTHDNHDNHDILKYSKQIDLLALSPDYSVCFLRTLHSSYLFEVQTPPLRSAPTLITACLKHWSYTLSLIFHSTTLALLPHAHCTCPISCLFSRICLAEKKRSISALVSMVTCFC